MENTLKMAGEMASHAIWSVSSGETLMPIFGYLKSDNSHTMQRLVMDPEQAMELGEQKMSNLDEDVLGAAFIKDGFVTLDNGKTDALIVDVRFAGDAEKQMQFIIPYRNARHPKGFAVHRLQLTRLDGIPSDGSDSLVDAFFDGIESHPQGGKIWDEKYVDQAGDTADFSEEDSVDIPSEDYAALKQSPFLVFFLVAGADGKMDKKELISFAEILSDPDKLSSGFLKRIAAEVISDSTAIVTNMANSDLNYIEELGILRRVIDDNLSTEEGLAFKTSLLMIGKEIAEASGGFLGFGNKISKEEKGILALIALSLGIDPV